MFRGSSMHPKVNLLFYINIWKSQNNDRGTIVFANCGSANKEEEG